MTLEPDFTTCVPVFRACMQKLKQRPDPTARDAHRGCKLGLGAGLRPLSDRRRSWRLGPGAGSRGFAFLPLCLAGSPTLACGAISYLPLYHGLACARMWGEIFARMWGDILLTSVSRARLRSHVGRYLTFLYRGLACARTCGATSYLHTVVFGAGTGS